MVGGSLKPLIGEVHRKDIAFDIWVELVCGCFSAVDELNMKCAEFHNIDCSRVYFDYRRWRNSRAAIGVAALPGNAPIGIQIVAVVAKTIENS